jgi:hypothetical protein
MADSRLSVRDRELFLAEPHIAALSVSAGPDRGPFTLPIWYQYTPGGEAWVLTPAGSGKVPLVTRHGERVRMGRSASGGVGMTGGACGVVVPGVRVGTTEWERPARLKFAA